MKSEKLKRLEAKGWVEETVSEFLGLSAEEESLIEARLQLSKLLKEQRQRHHITQLVLARRIQSSQSRVAKMEASDPSVSIDLLFKALFASGVSLKDVGKSLAQAA